MDSQALSATELRIILAVIGVIVFALIYLFGRPRKPGQGKRKLFTREGGGERVEPTLGDVENGGAGAEARGDIDMGLRGETDRASAQGGEPRGDAFLSATPQRKGPAPGARTAGQVDRIVTLYVSARPGETIHGASLIVAAEKAGLVFGDKNIFHRLVSGRPEAGPIFSMANMVKPGNFDMREIDALRTPGVCFFMALPGPMPALDGWDALLPTVQRMAELLDAVVQDEERNALGRQRIAHIRDELRAYDRKQDKNQIRLR